MNFIEKVKKYHLEKLLHYKELNKKQKLWICFLSIATIILIITALYITWSPIGGELALGVQGRYFIPVIILFLLCMCMKDNYIKIKNVDK